MATITSVGSGAWSAAGTWDTGVPANNDTVVIAAGHTVTFDVDTSAFANGIAGLTITGHATNPGMLCFKYSADGTYHLKLKTATTIAGTNESTKGRILANSDGVWGNSGALALGRKAVIDLQGTAYIDALYLDVALYCTQPTIASAEVYGTIQTVSSVDTAADTFTFAAPHGFGSNTAIMVRSSETLPGGLFANTVYYVRSQTTYSFKLSLFSGDPTVDITSVGSGTIQVYDGHSSTATPIVQVLDNVTGDPCWVTTDGHDHVALVDSAAPSTVDQQRIQLTTIAAGSLTLSANVNSVQYPGARVYLLSRNVRITSNTTAATNLVDYGAGVHSGVFQCEIRSTAGTGTTFWGNGISGGAGHTTSGTISGCGYGVNAGTGHTISGLVAVCNYGVYQGTGHAIPGTVSGCNSGVYQGTGNIITGTINGCSNAVYGGTAFLISGLLHGCSSGTNIGTGHTVSGLVNGCQSGINNCLTGIMVTGTVRGCSSGLNNCVGVTMSGTISGCGYGVNYGWGNLISGHVDNVGYGFYDSHNNTISGVVNGCGSGVYMGSGNIISGTVNGCTTGIWQGSGLLYGATFTGNVLDIELNGKYWQGVGATLAGTTQVIKYKCSDVLIPEMRTAAVAIHGFGAVAGAIGFWTLGGFTKSVPYAVGTHGTPPVTLTLVHETTVEDSNRITWVEYTVFAKADQTVTVTLYGKLTGVATWVTRPTIGIYDPSKAWQAPAEALNVSALMADNTDWQTLTATYVATYDRELRVRVQATGGAADGTGTEKLYWFAGIDLGGNGAVSISPARG